jgi:hypothetical protein
MNTTNEIFTVRIDSHDFKPAQLAYLKSNYKVAKEIDGRIYFEIGDIETVDRLLMAHIWSSDDKYFSRLFPGYNK